MMQLLCNGVRLDVSEGTQLAFKRANILFAFDSIECERTLSFTLPSTPTNERVIGLAKLPEMSGEGMRRKFACQMQFGVVALDGYLYVTEYTKKGYAAVFVTGELLGLQALRDAGKVADILDASTIVTWTAQKMTPQQAQGELWAVVDYMTQGHVNASIEVQELIAAVCEGLDIAEPEIPNAAQGARIIPAKMRSLAEVGVTIARTFVSTPSTEQPGVQVNAEAITIVPELFDANVTGKTYRLIQERVDGEIVSTMYYSVVQQLRTKAPVTITFPADFPSDVFIGYFSNAYEFGNFTFFGDYAFSLDTAKTITGTPLAGRSVDIPSGANFVFLRYDEYHNAGDPAGTIVDDTGFELTGDVTAAVMVQGTEDTVPFGSAVRLQDNLPDVTLVELLKIVAALSGTVLTYSAQSGVAFDEVDVSGWPVVCVDSKLMELTDVRRTFGKYAQRNVVECESAEYVPASARVKAVYTIDNDNIDAEQVLQVIPFSEGRNGGAVGSRSYIETEGGEDEEKDSIADAATSLPKMLRVQLPLCDSVQGLCARSTCISVRVAMSYYEYNGITPQTLIQVRGVRYVWTEATWQKGVARFSLSALEIEEEKPAIYYPFKTDKALAGYIKTVNDADGAFYTVQDGMKLTSDGATVQNSDKGLLITNWNIPFSVFATEHTYDGETYRAVDVTAAAWIKIRKEDVLDWVAGATVVEQKHNGYLYNGAFYTDAAHTELIEATAAAVYIDKVSNVPYRWNGEAYVGVSYSANGAILANVDAYQYMGLVFDRTQGDYQSMRLWMRNRRGGYSEDVTRLLYYMTCDTWVHVAFTVELDTKKMRAYINGAKVAEGGSVRGFGQWNWALQYPVWVMSGSSRATRYPITYKDVRVYARRLDDGEINKLYMAGV